MTSLYDSPASEITFEIVSDFLANALDTDLLTESQTVELKERPRGANVVEAVAAMANTDGGLVLVGVADSGELPERFVGITQGQALGLTDQLRSMLSGQMPELIFLRIPGKDRVVGVVRIDADGFERPVVVGGRVLLRVPGQTVPADRDRILGLTKRPAAAADIWPLPLSPTFPADPMRFDLTEEAGGHLSLRVEAWYQLPRRALQYPWLSSQAQLALIESLNSSAVPKDVWLQSGTPPQGRSTSWAIFQARSTSIRARSMRSDQVSTPQRPDCGGGAYLGRAGRDLGLLLELTVANVNQSRPVTMSLEQIVEGFLAVVVAATDALSSVAVALGCDEPSRLASLKGWLLPGGGHTLSEVLPLDQYARHGQPGSTIGDLPLVRPPSRDRSELDRLVRAWVNACLLDDAVYGFEEDLEAVPDPWWLRTS